MFTGRNRKQFGFIAAPECNFPFHQAHKACLPTLQAELWLRQPWGRVFRHSRSFSKTSTSWKEQPVSLGKGEVSSGATAAPSSHSRSLTGGRVEFTFSPGIHTVKHPCDVSHLAISSRMTITCNYCSALFIFSSLAYFVFPTGHLNFSPDYLNSQLLSYYLMLPVPVPFHLWRWMHLSKQFLMDEMKELLLRRGNGRGEGSRKEVNPWALSFAVLF